MKRLTTTIALATLVWAGSHSVRAQETARRFVPVTDAMLQKPDPANWMMWRRTLDSWGYSPLNQINQVFEAMRRSAIPARVVLAFPQRP